MSATGPGPREHVHALSCWCRPQRDLSDLTRLVHTTQTWTDEDGVTHVVAEITIGEDAPRYHEEIRA